MIYQKYKNFYIRDYFNALKILCIVDYKELMYENQGIHPNKAVMKMIDKLASNLSYEQLDMAFMTDKDFGPHVIEAMALLTFDFDQIKDLVAYLRGNIPSLMLKIVSKLGGSSLESYDDDFNLDRSSAACVMEFVDHLDMDRAIKYDVFHFLMSPDKLINDLLDQIDLVYPYFLKDLKRVEDQLSDIEAYIDQEIREKGQAVFGHVLEGIFDVSRYQEVMISSSYVNSKALSCNCLGDRAYIEVGFEFPETLKLIRGGDRDKEVLQVLNTISDPMKFKIILSIKEKPAYGKELIDITGLSKASLSYHIGQLRNMGIINSEKVGNRMYYSLKKDKLVGMVEDLLEKIK